MDRLIWIGLAGAMGTAARYLVGLWAAQRLGSSFPYGTLIVNLTGCLIIAVLMYASGSLRWPDTTRLALTVGFVGGYTTYSSFNYETMRLVEAGQMRLAFLNVAVTLVGGLVFGWLGLIAARAALGR